MLKFRVWAAVLAAAVMVSPVFAQDALKVPSSVPFVEDNDISDSIKTECQLGTDLAGFVKQYAEVPVELVDGPLDTGSGRVLQLTITDAVSMGNAWIGHQKFTKIKGSLFENGQKVASFKARRNSMGGAFAGFKGSCSVLGRTVEALGEDVGEWLKNPRDGATLGD